MNKDNHKMTATEPKTAYKLQSAKIDENDDIEYFILHNYTDADEPQMLWSYREGGLEAQIVKDCIDDLNKLWTKKNCKNIRVIDNYIIFKVPKAYLRRAIRKQVMKRDYEEVLRLTEHICFNDNDIRNHRLTLFCEIYRCIKTDAERIADDDILVMNAFD